MEWCKAHKKDYLPVVFPGFSWNNLKKNPKDFNSIPRLGGKFLWEQYVQAKKIGATMIYQAMFDEVNEGTAIFKCTNTPPVGASGFVTYEGQPIGTAIKAKVIKNKVAPPFKEADFVIKYGRGIDRTLDILRSSLVRGIVVKGGTWWKYGDIQLGQGEENASEFLFQNPEVMAEIVAKVLKC
jgi:hypothetical protein